ncbi:MAG: 5'-nucleotidase C-terminal domain-containing protein [Comamonadaceae bacterium]|nr:5'-nucleotidase C-terminal domain-containing protein [Comamonadaceae bacterium]
MLRLPVTLPVTLLLACALTACGGGDEAAPQHNFKLRVLHTNDHHSYLDGTAYDLNLGADTVRLQIGGMARVAGAIKSLRTENSLVLNSGELNGTLYFSLFRGEADFKLFNEMGLDAYQIGNHEFDEGEAVLANLLALAKFPVLAGNMRPTENSPLFGAKLQPYVIKQYGAERVGVIGVLKVSKTVGSSMVTDAVKFDDELQSVKASVAELQRQGINKIVLLSHLGFDADQALTGQLSGVDVIIGGDTHDLLDHQGELKALGLTPTGVYPTVKNDSQGKPVYIAQAWEYARGLGALDVEFNPAGEVIGAQGRTLLLVDEPYQIKGSKGEFVAATAAQSTEIAKRIAANAGLRMQQPDAAADAVLAPYRAQLDHFKTQLIGSVAENMGFERLPTPFEPGQKPSGSYAAYAVALSFLSYSPKADIAIQNAGGVRSAFMQGEFSVADAYTMLPFSNTIATVQLSGADVHAVLEDAADYALNSTSTGAFPYAAYLRFDVVRSAPKGQRIRNLEIKQRASGRWVPLDLQANYKVVTNSFTALGKDGYTTFATAIAKNPAVHEDSKVAYVVPLIELFTRHLPGQRLDSLQASEYSLKSVR